MLNWYNILFMMAQPYFLEIIDMLGRSYEIIQYQNTNYHTEL